MFVCFDLFLSANVFLPAGLPSTVKAWISLGLDHWEWVGDSKMQENFSENHTKLELMSHLKLNNLYHSCEIPGRDVQIYLSSHFIFSFCLQPTTICLHGYINLACRSCNLFANVSKSPQLVSKALNSSKEAEKPSQMFRDTLQTARQMQWWSQTNFIGFAILGPLVKHGWPRKLPFFPTWQFAEDLIVFLGYSLIDTGRDYNVE